MKKSTTPKAAKKITAPKTPVAKKRDARLPGVGTTLTRTHGKKELKVKVLADGFAFEGRTYRSLSAVATKVAGGNRNGFTFFGLTKTAKGKAA